MTNPSPDLIRQVEADPRVEDLAMLVRRLVRKLDKECPGTDLAPQALDYLKRKGLASSPLRVDTAVQVEAESVDSPEFRKALAEYLRASDDPSSCVNDDIKALTAHIDSIITARVAAEREQIATMSFDLSMVSGDAFQEGAAYGIGKYRMAIRALAASQAAPAKAEGWQLVPVKPTPEMLHALYVTPDFVGSTIIRHSVDKLPDAYRAMLAAAPSTPAKEST